MGFTHSWNGTVLTITSDSGTSSADLQGPVGDTGPRGPQGVGGDGSGINLSDYYTKTEVDAAIDSAVEDLAGTGDLATKEYVSSAIASAQLEGVEVDLSAYYTKSETDAAISNATPDLTNYYTKTQVDSAIETALDNFEVPALPEDDVHLDGTLYYTKEEVYNKTEVNNIVSAIGNVDLTGYATEEYVNKKIATAQLEGADVDMSAYYTKTEVDSLVSSSTGSNVDLSNYYTKTEIEALGHLTEAEVLALIQANIPTYADGNEVSY